VLAVTAVYLAGVVLVLSGVAYVAYRVGADTAQRRAYYTIATLRRQLSTARLELDRERERATRLARIVDGQRPPVVKLPTWMDGKL
jgi:hypothetical protein